MPLCVYGSRFGQFPFDFLFQVFHWFKFFILVVRFDRWVYVETMSLILYVYLMTTNLKAHGNPTEGHLINQLIEF